MNNFKGTRGNAFVSNSLTIEATSQRIEAIETIVTIATVNSVFRKKEEAEFNAQLFADSLNVRQQINCSLTELLESHNKMQELMKQYQYVLKMCLINTKSINGFLIEESLKSQYNQVKELLNKQ